MLRICQNKGFHLEFQNNWVISAQFGHANYCSNKDYNAFVEETMGILNSTRREKEQESLDCEIMVWNKNRESPLLSGGDTVKGWVSPDQLVQIMEIVRNLPEDHFDKNMLMTNSNFLHILYPDKELYGRS